MIGECVFVFSVADSGSGIQCFVDPGSGIRDVKNPALSLIVAVFSFYKNYIVPSF
jgi:hypothetical protein